MTDLLVAGRDEGAFPAAAAWVGVASMAGVRAFEGYVGGAERKTRWDVASLTKPMAVVDLCMREVSAGALDLDAPIEPTLPAFITPRALLGHRAGLPAWKDLVAALPPGFRPGSRATRLALLALVRQAAREASPERGCEYSDLGFMLLGACLEARLGPLAERVRGYRPIPERVRAWRGRGLPAYAGAGWCPWRGREVVGEVHDPNAWAWGGAAGHAGIFASARRVGRWVMGLARGMAAGIDPGVVRVFWERPTDGATWALGWDTPSPGASSAGATVGGDAVGHLGFTGTSVWVEPERGLVIVLLTNRVALGPEAQARLKAFRPRFHDEVRAALGRVGARP
ncbi:MAG: beta-lactamase family protein [Deltaproteobacteria bacterium]|nr:beta-lactamase family protein [Deltaproteobacteria bacterium]